MTPEQIEAIKKEREKVVKSTKIVTK